jgi:hypothetical protein
MINDTLRVASGGYLKRTSLTIAVDGYLGKTLVPIPPTKKKLVGGNANKRQQLEFKKLEFLDSEIIEIVKITLKHFTI